MDLKSNNTIFITSSNGVCRRRETTKGWEILVQWKYDSCAWGELNDMKECYPVQLCKYAVQSQISKESVFH